jgi:hypothetical protein
MVFTFKAEPLVHLMPMGTRPLGGVCMEVERFVVEYRLNVGVASSPTHPHSVAR